MKRYLVGCLIGAVILLIPATTRAVDIGLPFGGLVNAVIPCTCSGGLWIYYTPAFIGASVPATGALWYPPAARLYAWFQLGVPGTWNLGAYTPGVSSCLVTAPNPSDPCIPLPALGTIQYMGTSKLF